MNSTRFQELKEDSSRDAITFDDHKEMIVWMVLAREILRQLFVAKVTSDDVDVEIQSLIT